MDKQKIRLGLCCINTVLKAQNPTIHCFRQLNRNAFKDKGVEEAQQRSLENVKDLYTTIEWNEKNGITLLRVGSEMFPRATDEKCGYSISFAKEELKKAGDLAKKYNHRLTFHPGQYNVIGTPNEKAFQSTIDQLSHHAEIFKYMGFENEKDSVIVLHGGGLYGDKDSTIKRWVDNFGRLPKIVQDKLVIENCEKCYTIRDCLNISKEIEKKYGFALPVVVDSHHYECYNIFHPDETQESFEKLLHEASQTWIKRGIRMKCHVSQQGQGLTGHHSDYITQLPQEYLDLPKKLGINLDIFIEAKQKEQAIFLLYKIYPELDTRNDEMKKSHSKYEYNFVNIDQVTKEIEDKVTALKSSKTKINNDCKEGKKDACCDDHKINKKKNNAKNAKNAKDADEDCNDVALPVAKKATKKQQKPKKKQSDDEDDDNEKLQDNVSTQETIQKVETDKITNKKTRSSTRSVDKLLKNKKEDDVVNVKLNAKEKVEKKELKSNNDNDKNTKTTRQTRNAYKNEVDELDLTEFKFVTKKTKNLKKQQL